MKTHRGAAKRFRFTASGKIKKMRAGRRHLLAKKSAKRKRRLRAPDYVGAANVRQVKKLLPYG